MTNAVIAFVALLTWIASAYKLRSLRTGSPAARALWFALTFLAIALTCSVNSVYTGVDSVVGRANFAQLIKDAAVVLSACSTQILLLHLSKARGDAGMKPWNRLAVVGIALVAMAVFFLVAAPGQEDVKYVSRHGADSGLLEYRLVYLAYVAFAFADIVRLCRRFARVAGELLLSFGLRVVAAGGLLGVVYSILSGVALVVARDGSNQQVTELQSALKVVIALATLLVVGGSTLPAWGPRVGVRDPAGGVRSRRRLRRIEPLWSALTDALPEVVLDEIPTSRTKGAAEEKLYRRVIEIEDARLALKSHIRPDVDGVADVLAVQRGWDGIQVEAAVEAARLSDALRALDAGTAERHATVPSRRRDGMPDLESESRWLAAVADAYRDRAFMSEVERRLPSFATAGAGEGDSHDDVG